MTNTDLTAALMVGGMVVLFHVIDLQELEPAAVGGALWLMYRIGRDSGD